MSDSIKATVTLECEGRVETLEMSCREVRVETIYDETFEDWPWGTPRRRLWNRLGERIEFFGIYDGIRCTSRVKEAEKE